jgi:hypothetical protein
MGPCTSVIQEIVRDRPVFPVDESCSMLNELICHEAVCGYSHSSSRLEGYVSARVSP